MIRIQQLKLPITHTEQQLLQKAAKILRIKSDSILEYKIRRQSWMPAEKVKFLLSIP